jgi:hypothetical protein
LTNDIPKHGAAYEFTSGLYRDDTLWFQAVDLGDTAGLSIRVSEHGGPVTACETTLTLDQLSEFACAMFAALNQAGQIEVEKHASRLLGLIKSGIYGPPCKAEDGA